MPFAEVQASEFVFEADPTDTARGIFRVTTTEPMICAIVWGETDEFGNINNSLAMNGTGIVEHDVFLPGAVPGRTYVFRVQGSTGDGTLYQSETGTFMIPDVDTVGAPAVTVDHGPNLALDATAMTASSEFNESFAAENAIDDSGTTEWSSEGYGDNAFTETFTVTVDDIETLGPFPAGTPIEPNLAAIDVTGRVFRFDVETSTGGNVGAVEVRLVAP